MGLQLGHTSTGALAPWSVGARPLFEALQRHLASDAAALGLIDVRDPKPDAFLSALGIDPARLARWCEHDHLDDPLLRDARRRGLAPGVAAEDQPGPAVPPNHQAMVLLLPTSVTSRRTWYLAVGRPDRPFEPPEQRHAALLLRALRAQFDHVVEPALGRVLLDQAHGLLHADPFTEGWLLDQPEAMAALRELLPAVVAERWPDLADEVTHDVALRLADTAVWIRFMRMRPMPAGPSHYWSLELRPLIEDDIPPIGTVSDPRVARALAFLTDRYAEAPTLAEVAEHVQTSPFHFHRLFVRQVDLSPKHYLLRMQLMVAKWLLRATRQSIGEIATATGFASHGHFTATFHRMVGTSPSTYRETR